MANSRETAPFGTWPSAITPELMTGRNVHLSQVRVDGNETYWVEGRTTQGGRQVLLRRRSDGTTQEVLPMTPENELVDVRTRVHEYGGKAYAVAEGVIVVSHGGDGRVYKLDLEASRKSLEPLTPAIGHRYADFTIDTVRGLVYAVRERHTRDGVLNDLVAIPLDGSAAREADEVRVIVTGADFIAAPDLNPAGTILSWMEWEHPHMPWNRSRLCVANLDFEGYAQEKQVLCDGANCSVVEPRWSPGGDLVYVCDKTGFWNLYRVEGLEQGEPRSRAIHPAERNFSVAMWIIGLHTYDFLDDDHIVCSWAIDGIWHLGCIRLANGECEEWPINWQPSGNVACSDGRVVLLAESATHRPAVVEVKNGRVEVLRRTSDEPLQDEDISIAQQLSWEAGDGQKVHGFYYAPHSRDFEGAEGALPPLIVSVHGGPTAAARPGLDLDVQFWTSRGFAYLDVNYRGSTAYGRAYREALEGLWGIAEVEDLASGVRFLAEQGLIDPERVAVRGASAGGYSALRALDRSDVFSAAVSIGGVTDLVTLRAETHKFERYYVDRLIGVDGDTKAGQAELARRSPLHNIGTNPAPLLLLQGEADTVVPVSQAQNLYDARVAAGLGTALKIYPGEGHMLRTAHSIQDALLSELSFYQQVFGFPVEHPELVEITS
ncbi:MAG: prolyl oligopeptidase family serine peptidase [Buchananella hordeovulneris]|nr:prolyl oligopeptidase family serine peptidase [Buchananella hordeovulneris]